MVYLCKKHSQSVKQYPAIYFLHVNANWCCESFLILPNKQGIFFSNCKFLFKYIYVYFYCLLIDFIFLECIERVEYIYNKFYLKIEIEKCFKVINLLSAIKISVLFYSVRWTGM